MTRDQILDNLYRSKDTDQIIRNILQDNSNTYLLNEAKQELFQALAELPEDKLLGLHARNELRWWIIGILRNCLRSNKGTFYYKIRRFGLHNVANGKDETFDRIEDLTSSMYSQPSTKETYLTLLRTHINSLEEFDRRIVLLYLELGTYKAVACKLGINEQMIQKIMKRIRAELKDFIQKDIADTPLESHESTRKDFTYQEDDEEQAYHYYSGRIDKRVEQFDREHYGGPAIIEPQCELC